MVDRVRIEVTGHVAQVTLNRAEKNNAVDEPMFAALTEAGESLRDNLSVRAVVICGAGGNFCAGLDIGAFQGDGVGFADPSKLEPRGRSPANVYQSAAYVWRELPVPVIAAIEGYAFGAGLQIALGADLRYASPAAQLSIMEIKWGLIPDMALSTTLRHVLPVDRVKELAYTGRVVGGEEGARMGLVTALHDDPIAAALDTAGIIAGRSPEAIRSIKTLVNGYWQASEAASLKAEAMLQAAVMRSPNQKEAVMANLHKRPAQFADPEQ